MRGESTGESRESGGTASGAPGGEIAGWLLVSLAAPPFGEALLLVDALRALGARLVEREGARVVALFPPHDDPADLAAEIRLAARASTRLADPDVTWRRVEPDQRIRGWGGGHPPRRVSRRLVVVTAPAGNPGAGRDRVGGVEPRPGDRVIRLEASVAFGTAEHPTTRSCLRLLDGLVAPGDRVLDVGAGSAVLSIAATLLGARRATALESDPLSCAAARRNVARNGVADRVRVEELEVASGSLGRRGRFEGVVANLQAGILRPLLGDFAGVLAEGGWLVVSGVVRVEREAVLGAANAAGLHLVEEEVEDGWWTARLGR